MTLEIYRQHQQCRRLLDLAMEQNARVTDMLERVHRCYDPEDGKETDIEVDLRTAKQQAMRTAVTIEMLQGELGFNDA